MHREPHWLRTWLLTAVLAMAALASLEAFWRSAEHLPTVMDDLDLWAEQRTRIDAGGPKTLVTLGMSRMQMDFDSQVFAERYPDWILARLEAPLTNPLAALQNLADDGEFRGIVLVSLTVPWTRPGLFDGQEKSLAHYRDSYGWKARLDRRIATAVQSSFVFVHPNLQLRKALEERLSGGEWPGPRFVRVLPDRGRRGHYYDHHRDLNAWRKTLERYTRKKHRRDRPDPETSLEGLRPFDVVASKIAARGGEVIYIRLPTSGPIWEMDERFYPKAGYWDRFANETRAPTLHFRDVPTLAGVQCVDGSHLDVRDAPRFTGLLLDELVAWGWLPPPRSPSAP